MIRLHLFFKLLGSDLFIRPQSVDPFSGSLKRKGLSAHSWLVQKNLFSHLHIRQEGASA